MNLRDLRYLAALDEHRHFGRAAAACFVSQPTLSTQVKKLEIELGVALIERAPRKVLFTATGQAILAEAREALAHADRIRTLAKAARTEGRQPIRLGIFPTLGPYLLPHVLPDLHRSFPRIELLLTEEKTEVVLAKLHEGKLDAVIVALPFPDDGLESEFLFEEPFVLAVPASHPLAKRNSVDLEDLTNERLLLLEDGHCLRDQALEVCTLAGAGERTGFRATSLETLRHMVATEVGITLLPVLATRPPAAGIDAMRLVPFRGTPPSRRIAMAWRKSTPLGDLLRRLSAAFRVLPPDLLAASPPSQKTAAQ
ncbi:MAG: LysR substrate-binding domain-containing protein [Gammaproteobacteria bacterium]|nr:LysR substrate-binding domain-containing protein [Gammaproteobacteria bacterium]